ncbi:hypothetical protein SMD22_01350 (plasmid) [Brevibacillus halotolerans]|nr:hypothetical protein SMD22_01350 [Brevibacillus halotolerans]
MKKDFHAQITQATKNEDDQPMYQYFAQHTSTQQTPQVNVTHDISERVIKTLDDTRLQKAGYWIMVLVLTALLIPFFIKMNVAGIISATMMIALTILSVKKVTCSYDSNTNFYLANATLTLKAMFRYFSVTAKLLPYSDKILKSSVIVMMMEHFVLRWFLFVPLSGLIYTIGFYGMWLGVLLCFAKRETTTIYRGLMLAYVYHLIAILLNGVFNNDLYIFTVISALILWTIAGWMKKSVIEDIKPSNK